MVSYFNRLRRAKLITELITEPFPESVLANYRDKWLNIGTSCEPLDFEKACSAADKAYAAAQLPVPIWHLHFRSPVEAAKAAVILKKTNKPDLTSAELQEYIEEKLSRTTRFSQASMLEALDDQVYGSHDAGWLGFYDLFLTESKLECCRPLEGLIELAKVCGWWAPYEKCVIFQDRHAELNRDMDGRLHCPIGPAVRYRDGFSVYAWHGVTVPGEWIEHPETLTAEMGLTWENIEQRRVICEIMGWGKILDDTGAVVIDEDPDPEIGTLLEANIPGLGVERFLRVLEKSSGREFVLPVDGSNVRARQANAASYGILEEELNPDFRV